MSGRGVVHVVEAMRERRQLCTRCGAVAVDYINDVHFLEPPSGFPAGEVTVYAGFPTVTVEGHRKNAEPCVGLQ